MAIYNINYLNESLINNFVENTYNDIFDNVILIEAFNPKAIVDKAVQFVKKIFDKIKEIIGKIKKKIQSIVRNRKQQSLRSKSKNDESLKTKQFLVTLVKFEYKNLRDCIKQYLSSKIVTSEQEANEVAAEINDRMRILLEPNPINGCFNTVHIKDTLSNIVDIEGEILMSSLKEADKAMDDYQSISAKVASVIENSTPESNMYPLITIKALLTGLLNIINKVDVFNDRNIAIVDKLIEDANPLNDM